MKSRKIFYMLVLISWAFQVQGQSVPNIWADPEWTRQNQGDTIFYRDENEILRLKIWKDKQDRDSVFMAFSKYGALQIRFSGKSRLPLQGEARFYYPTGRLKELNHWVEDHPESRFELYYENGNLKESGKYEGEQKSGFCKSYYPSGSIREKGSFDLGIKNGRWQYFHPDSLPAFEENWEEGGLMEISPFRTRSGRILPSGNLKNGNGEGTRYHLNGNRKQTFRLLAGLPEGILMEYDTLGRPLRMMQFESGELCRQMLEFNADSLVVSRTEYQKGLRNGSFQSYSDAGKLLMTGWYKNGLEDSLWQETDEKGNLLAQYFFKKGKPDGPWLEYFGNRNLKKSAWFTDGLQDSLSLEWNEKGVKISEYRFSGGEKNGPSKTWYASGMLKNEGHFQHDAEEGKWTFWFENGKKQAEGRYRQGRPEGVWKNWYGDEKLASEGQYMAGKETGEWVFNYPNGTLKARELWDKGRLISVKEARSPKGKVLDAGKVINGNGMLKTYDIEGWKEGEGKMENGLQEGIWTYFHPGGIVKARGLMKNGKRTGLWKFYRSANWMSEETMFLFDNPVGKTRLYDPEGNLIDEIENEEPAEE